MFNNIRSYVPFLRNIVCVYGCVSLVIISVCYATVGKIMKKNAATVGKIEKKKIKNSSSTTQGQSFCEICLENRENREMFTNKSCRHSFCYECTSKHTEMRMKEKEKSITCPSPNCEAALEYDDRCRQMISEEVLEAWDRFLCESCFPESEKLFCPFHNCSVMLIIDPGKIIKKTECPECKRLFCAQCRVPWHENFNCSEVRAMSAGDRDELMFNSLAEKKNWQKCPNCKIHVERVYGCKRMTCRCKHQFCYLCGSNWIGSFPHLCTVFDIY